jgi:23S rRNA pseudouridine1911/1915/1917 synthase
MKFTFVPNEDVGKMRLDIFLRARMDNSVSRSNIQQYIRDGQVMLEGQVVTSPHFWLKKHTNIAVKVATDEDGERIVQLQEKPPYTVQYVGMEYIIIDKPAGMLVHPVRKDSDVSVTDYLLRDFPEVASVGDDREMRPGIVHRLDRDVRGLMVIARTQACFEHLKGQFTSRTVFKEYQARVHGVIEKDHGFISLPIGFSKKDSTKRQAYPVPGSNIHIDMESDFLAWEQSEKYRGEFLQYESKLHKKLKPALTEFLVETRESHYTIVKIRLHTGRTHQIRVHMKAFDHPIAGDTLYGEKDKYEKIQLIAKKIGFVDTQGQMQEYTSEFGLD